MSRATPPRDRGGARRRRSTDRARCALRAAPCRGESETSGSAPTTSSRSRTRPAPPPLAGQFYMLAAADGWGGERRGARTSARAFSVCRARGRRLEFLLEAIGPGTERLASACAPATGRVAGGPARHRLQRSGLAVGRALLVGGGIGVAPLVIWAERCAQRRAPAMTLLGFRSDTYAQRGAPASTATSRSRPTTARAAATTGSSPTCSQRELDARATRPCTRAGRPPMLEAVRRICAARAVPAQLALEAGMACGFGACFGCVVRTRHGYRRLCVDGPVVAAADLEEAWE